MTKMLNINEKKNFYRFFSNKDFKVFNVFYDMENFLYGFYNFGFNNLIKYNYINVKYNLFMDLVMKQKFIKDNYFPCIVSNGLFDFEKRINFIDFCNNYQESSYYYYYVNFYIDRDCYVFNRNWDNMYKNEFSDLIDYENYKKITISESEFFICYFIMMVAVYYDYTTRGLWAARN